MSGVEEADLEEWSPPVLSEAEKREQEARRRRSDLVAKRMGDYLLKGYRMLATACPVCGNVLLQDRQKNDVCVACSEVDGEVAKETLASSEKEEQKKSKGTQQSNEPSGTTTNWEKNLAWSASVVNKKMHWASRELNSSAEVESSIQLVYLIKGCAEALNALQQCSKGSPPANYH